MYKRKTIYSINKRFVDILFSLLGLILLSWLLIILAILVKLTSKGPALYGHERIGRNGKTFKLWKFRSMKYDSRPLEEILSPEQLEEYKKNYKITNDPRITKMGKFLRKTSLDELPQLFNIFIGNMSIIGWRPVLQEDDNMFIFAT
jgi:lipopolysaccharide/colanic/teichoic acid biosynthesis glycosyltransferase